MSLTYGFYNSVNGDRAYNANQMSELFEGIIHDGIFEDIGDKMMVSANTGMYVKVGTGRAWFNNTWTKNDSNLNIAVEAADVVLPRIDTVVLEINLAYNVRANTIQIIKGTTASSPVAPTIYNTDDKFRYPLANILVGANVTSIVSGNITNRVGTIDCPYVTGVLKNIDTVAIDTRIAIINGLISDLETSMVSSAPLTSSIGYYVSKTGNDANNGLTSGTAFLTIGKALSMLPKQFQNADASIYVGSGTYNEYVNVRGFFGNGNLYINGTESPTKPVVYSMNVYGCNLNSTTITNFDPDNINVVGSSHATLDYFKCDSNTITLQDSLACYVNNSSFSGANPCILSTRNSTVAITNNSGSGNTKVLEANGAGTIIKMGAVGITGTIAETVATGGLIR